MPSILEHSDHSQPYQHLRLPYFVYGTLRPGGGNDRRWKDLGAKDIGEGRATVEGFSMYVTTGGQYGIPYVISGPSDRKVIGALILPPADAGQCVELRDSLDRLETWPRHYNRVVVNVDVPDVASNIRAWMYSPIGFPHGCRWVSTGNYFQQYATKGAVLIGVTFAAPLPLQPPLVTTVVVLLVL